jgi:hypothetical protein
LIIYNAVLSHNVPAAKRLVTAPARPRNAAPYARACDRFFAWCEDRGLTLTTIRPHDVATYIETLQQTHAAPGVLAARGAVAVRLADHRPGCAVQSGLGGAWPQARGQDRQDVVLDGKEWRHLIDTIPTDTVRDRALIAPPHLWLRPRRRRAQDARRRPAIQGHGRLIRLHEKGGKQHMMPRHHALAEALRAYIDAAGIAADKKGFMVPHIATTWRNRAGRSAHGPGRCLAHGSQARARRRHHGADR